ncbi:MAG: cupin domain-containing protein [Geminicoccaceae bacterium]
MTAQPVLAQEQKEEYVSKAERNVLVEKPLPGAEGKMISINLFKLPAEYVGGKHYHSGPTYVYVLKGMLTIEEVGKPAQTFEAGELYEEPIGNPMQAFNKSADEPIELLVVQVQNEGEPLMYQAE